MPITVARASAVLIFAFLGVEAALTPSGEVRDSSRTVPRAIFVAMVGITVLYIAVQLVTQGILGAQLAGQKTPVAEAAAAVLGSEEKAHLAGFVEFLAARGDPRDVIVNHVIEIDSSDLITLSPIPE